MEEQQTLREGYALLSKCPVCGAEIEYSAYQQYEEVFKVTKFGKLASRKKYTRNAGSMDCGYLSCTNRKCNFITDCDLVSEQHKEITIQYKDGSFVYKKS